jgi:hypothetical protein
VAKNRAASGACAVRLPFAKDASKDQMIATDQFGEPIEYLSHSVMVKSAGNSVLVSG